MVPLQGLHEPVSDDPSPLHRLIPLHITSTRRQLPIGTSAQEERYELHRLQGRRPLPGAASAARRSSSPSTRCPASWPSAPSTPTPAAGRRPHHRLAAHDHPDRRAHRDAHRPRRRRALVQLQHLLDPGPRRRRRSSSAPRAPPTTPRASRSSPGRARRSRSTGGAPSRCCAGPSGAGPNMILDDGGDATLLVHKGTEYEAAGAVPATTEDDSEEWEVVLGLAAPHRRRGAAPLDRSAPASWASPRRPPPACTASTR